MEENDRDVAVFSSCTPEVRRSRSKAIFVGHAGDVALRKVWPGVQNLCLEGHWPEAAEAVDWAILWWEGTDSKRAARETDRNLERTLSELTKAGISGPSKGQLSVDGLAEFKGLDNLRTLELRLQKALDDERMATLPALPHLRHVSVVHCAGLGDGTLHWLSQCPQLRTIMAWNAGQFSERAMGKLLLCRKLDVLDIGLNCGLDALGLMRLCELVPDVKVIVRKMTPFFSRLAMSFADAAKAKPLCHERFSWNELLWRRTLNLYGKR